MPRFLTLGPEPLLSLKKAEQLHYPVLKVCPTNCSLEGNYSHLLLTSKTTVRLLLECAGRDFFAGKTILAVGKATAALLQKEQIPIDYVAQEETAEGMLALLDTVPLADCHLLWPHSERARNVLEEGLKKRSLSYHAPILYTLELQIPPNRPPLTAFDGILFSSPSTIEGFLNAYGTFPKDKILRAIGPVTQAALRFKLGADEQVGRDAGDKVGYTDAYEESF